MISRRLSYVGDSADVRRSSYAAAPGISHRASALSFCNTSPPKEKTGDAVLFFALPMVGHVKPLARIASGFARQPAGYRIAFCIADDGLDAERKDKLLALVPPECHAYFAEGGILELYGMPMADYFEQMSVKCTDLVSSLGQQYTSFAQPAARKAYPLAIAMCKEIQAQAPRLVVADSGFAGPWLHPVALCQTLGAGYVTIMPQARPDPAQTGGVGLILKLFARGYMRTIFKLLAALKASIQATTAATGIAPAPSSVDSLMLLPGSAALGGKPGASELYTGPFLPLPKQPKGRDDAALDEQQSLSDELLTWLEGSESSEPVLYVALGTLAKVTDGLAARIFYGLTHGPWRVLWSLPSAQQALLPEAARVSGATWRLEAFVPQQRVLRHPNVRGFLSHCGANSTLEAISCGVPMMCMPTLGDQFAWRDAICRAKAGLPLDKYRSSAATIRSAAMRLILSERFRAKAQQLASTMRAEAAGLAARFETPIGAEEAPPGVQVAIAACLTVLHDSPLRPAHRV